MKVEEIKKKYTIDVKLQPIEGVYHSSRGDTKALISSKLAQIKSMPGGITEARRKLRERALNAAPSAEQKQRLKEADDLKKCLDSLSKTAEKLVHAKNSNISFFYADVSTVIKKGYKILDVVYKTLKNT